MLDHSSIPTIYEDEDGFIAACDCGWQTDLYENKSEALDEFERVHVLANPRDDDDMDDAGGDFDGCWFCGQVGHFQASCPHKPLYKLK